MPLFEFSCLHCHTQFEKLLSSGANALPVCPHCGSTSVRKHFSTFASRVGSSVRANDIPSAGASGACCLNGNCNQ